ncbi:VacJ family lipoprotein [Sphingomonas sp. 1P08PE]|uniref:MlaA family lipoprotein n=1 Tax=Sphingomonas sp. 1P08PE TaxID=554122 RepID=UPI0039A22805
MLVLTVALLWSASVAGQGVPEMVAPAAPVTADPVVQDAPPPVPPAPPPADPNDIVVTGRGAWEAPDPMSGANKEAYKATQAVDKAVIGPVSRAYKKKVPGPIKSGIHNFLYNLREPVVFVNFLLQHKIGKAAETVGRFALNSTIGVAGLFDMAKRKPFKLPRRSNGFANTLGFYGVPNGPFMYLPLVGPTTVRDLFGGAVDRIVLPITLGQGVTDPKFAIPAGVLGALDHRAEFDDTLEKLEKAPGDPYVNARDFYLQRRQAEIDRLHGRAIGTTGGMTEAPTGPIKVKRRSDAAEVPPVQPTPPPPPTRTPVLDMPPAAAPVVVPEPAPVPVP